MPSLRVAISEDRDKCSRALVVRPGGDVTEQELREFGNRARQLHSKIFGTLHVLSDSMEGTQYAIIDPDTPGSYDEFVKVLQKILKQNFSAERI